MESIQDTELVIHAEGKGTVYCYQAIMTTSAGIWLGDNPFRFSLPLLLFQITIIFAATRLTHAVLRHLGQPLVISQIMGGIILGPSVLGRNSTFRRLMFSPKNREQLSTVSFLSFMLFLFTVGVKTDLGMIRKSGKKAVAVALAGTVVPLVLTLLAGFGLRNSLASHSLNMWLLFSIASKWCITSYTVLSCVLDELNLLTSKLGRLAMSASLIGDFFNYNVSTIFIAYAIGSLGKNPLLAVKSFATFVGFIAFILFVARPIVLWMIRRTPEGRMLDEGSFVAIMLLAIGCGFFSEVIGQQASMGPFFLGLVLPGGPPLGVTMVEKVERLICGVFLPVLVAIAGLRMDLTLLADVPKWGMLELFIFLLVAGKFIGVLVPCLYCGMPLRDAMAVGLMMNSKGIYEIDSANQWLNSQNILREQHTILILSVLLFGGTTAPLVKLLYRPEDRFIAYKRRTVQHAKRTDELRVLACVHNQEHVHPIVGILEASHPTRDSPICIYVLHLTPLVGRSAAVLIPYKKHTASVITSESDHIVKAFQALEHQLPGAVSIIPYVCISPHASMHDDVCSLALDKKASLVILPFHRHIAVVGSVETLATAIQNVNVHVLRYAPCSVGILVDHGIAGAHRPDRVAVYFLGGADDREALSCAARMAANPAVSLTVVRFKLQKDWKGEGREERLDDTAVEDFRSECTDGRRVVYREEVVRDSEGTAAVIRAMSAEFGLLIVGRREGSKSPLTEGLEMWSEYPELGVVGDMLASTDFGTRVATLVVQQQKRVAGGGAIGDSPRSRRVGAGHQVVPFDDEED